MLGISRARSILRKLVRSERSECACSMEEVSLWHHWKRDTVLDHTEIFVYGAFGHREGP